MNTSFIRQCPICNKDLYYSTKKVLAKAIKLNSFCKKCSGIKVKGEKNPFYGQKHTKETKQKMSGPRPDIQGENNPFAKSLKDPIKQQNHKNRCKQHWAKRDKKRRQEIVKSRLTGYGDINGTFWARIKNNAKSRNLELSITPEFLWNLFLEQDKKCKLSGLTLLLSPYKGEETTASVDRIDSLRGYTEDNVRWIHKKINIMKMAMTDNEFIEYCRIIVEFQNESSGEKESEKN